MSGLVGFPELWRSERGWLPLEIDDGLTEKSSPLGSRKPASRWSRKKAARGGASQENQNRTTSKAYISLMPKCAVFFPMFIYIYIYIFGYWYDLFLSLIYYPCQVTTLLARKRVYHPTAHHSQFTWSAASAIMA